MTIAINLRGTSGAGKSYLTRRLLAHYPHSVSNLIEGRRTPISTVYSAEGKTPLYTLGHYTADHGGGADSVNRADGFKWLNEAANTGGTNVLWEGVIFSDEVTNTVMLSRKIVVHVIFLTTSIDQCLADIRARREARGNVRPLSETNTANRLRSLDNAYARLRDARHDGLILYRMSREEAYEKCCELLGL